MSSSVNNNLPLQGLAALSHQAEFVTPRQGSSTSTNANRTNESTGPRRGRSGRVNRGRQGRGGHVNSRVLAAKQSEETSSSQQDGPVENVPGGSNDSPAGRVIGYKTSGGRDGGKNRHRQQTKKLIGGMGNMSGLGIDLVESIATTTENSSGNSVDTRKGKHATNQRKVNLTHLLNYNFERHPRRRYKSQSSDQGDSNYGSYHHHRGGHYRDANTVHKFSKQQFLQANCQFVVLDGHDYTVHKVDPDWPVDWDCIEEVRFKQCSSTETTCPICLEPPVAAKITRCGHIYCWTCMLHYLSLSDENCRQCPICFEPVYRSDLRSVVSHSFANHSVEEEISMRLMIRKKGCVEVEPYRNSALCETRPPGIRIDEQPYTSQANLVIVNPTTVTTNIAQRERLELLSKLDTDREEPEVCFVEQALGALDRRIEKLNLISMDRSRPRYDMAISQQVVDESSKNYLFYQCLDGQHIYLNPFSTKILCHEYGNLENCPLEIRAKILQMDWVSMSEAWRKRFRYLEHLPLTCEFRLLEIDFEKSDIVSPQTFKAFEREIVKRRQERERRKREERKREKIIQVEQNRKIYGIQPSLKINLNNFDQFPSVSDERYLGLTQPRVQSRTGDDTSSDDGNTSAEAGPVQPMTDQLTPSEQVSSQPETNDCEAAVAELTTSFRDIQLQEAAKELKNATKSRITQAQNSSWTARKHDPTAACQSSSFAQLLVDAKASNKEWTKTSTTKASNSSATSLMNSHSGSSQLQPMKTAIASALTVGSDDDDEEELRAPPCEFTISDFIDMNVKSGSNKRKSKISKKNGASSSSNKKGQKD